MLTPLQKKLRLKEGMSVLTISAPADFSQMIEASSAGIKTGRTLKAFEQIHWFVKNKKDVDAGAMEVIRLLENGKICWIYFPKGSSKMQTDLTRDAGWELLNEQPGLKWLTLVSFDDTWSAFSIRLEKETNTKIKKATAPVELSSFIDASKKLVKVPPDLQQAFNKNQEVAAFFNQLAFSHRKEYVEWIITAKKEETRKTRVQGTIERLNQKWKNPRNN